jgi:DTW domain-containing protein YfiP
VTCYRCFRPQGYCLCGVIPSVDKRTPVLIVQHPRERTHPFGTARLVELALSKVEVLVDHRSCLRDDPAPLGDLTGSALLYPHANAREISSLSAEQRPRRLIAIDGTWNHARTLYRDIPALHGLPHVTLPEHLRSGFQIRRQPHEYCLSTVEAIVHALRALDPETPHLDDLLAAFARMQQRQLDLPRDSGRGKKRARQRASRAIPRALIEGYESLVVAYAEPVFDDEEPRKRRLLSCVAQRPSTGERFEAILTRPGLQDAHLQYLGYNAEQVSSGLTQAQFRDRWQEFARNGQVLATWNRTTLDLLRGVGLDTGNSIMLKGAYYNLRRHRGSLDSIIRAEALGDTHPVGSSRAARRLNNSVCLARFMNAHGNP